MKTLLSNSVTGLCIGGMLITIVAGIFLHDLAIIKAGGALFIGSAILKTLLCWKD